MNTGTFVDTTRLSLVIGEDAKKAFDLRFSKGGIQSSKHGFVGWAGLKISAGQEVMGGKLTGTETTEGEGAGTTSVALNADAFDRVAQGVLAHRESQGDSGRDRNRNSRGATATDPRTVLSNRIGDTHMRLNEAQTRAEKGHWGVDFTPFKDRLNAIGEEAELLAIGKVDADAIKKMHQRLAELDDNLRAFGETEVLQDRIAVAMRGLEELEGSVSAPAYLKIKEQFDQVVKFAESGDARAARGGLYGDEGVFAAIGNLRRIARGKNTPGSERGSSSYRQAPRQPASASLGEHLVAQEASRAGSEVSPTSPKGRSRRSAQRTGAAARSR